MSMRSGQPSAVMSQKRHSEALDEGHRAAYEVPVDAAADDYAGASRVERVPVGSAGEDELQGLWQAMVRVRLRRVKAWDRASVNLGRSPGRRSAYLVEVSFDGDAVLPMVQGAAARSGD